jgi:hypothetical protein
VTAPIRRKAQAVCLVAAPVLLLGSHLLQPSHGTETKDEVAAQAANAGAFEASTVVGLLAMLAVFPAVLAMARLLSDRWSGHIGGALAMAGAVGLTFLLGTGVGATVIAGHAGTQAVQLTDELEGAMPFGVGVGLMLLGWTFGLITLAVGLGRRGVVPWWAAACIALTPLVPAFAGGRTPVAVSFVLLLVGFAALVPPVLDEAVDERVPSYA